MTDSDKSKTAAEQSKASAEAKSPGEAEPNSRAGSAVKSPLWPKFRKPLIGFAALFGIVYAVAAIHGLLLKPHERGQPNPEPANNASTDQSNQNEATNPVSNQQTGQTDQGGSDQLTQLQAQRAQLETMVEQCSQALAGDTQRQAFIASGIDPRPPPQINGEDCTDQKVAGWSAQISGLDAQINRAQGIASTPCSASGVCDHFSTGSVSPSPYSPPQAGEEQTPTDSAPSSGNGQTPAERFSEQGILGQGHFIGADGTDFTLSLQSNYYYRVPYTNDIVGTELDQPPDADHTERLTPQQ